MNELFKELDHIDRRLDLINAKAKRDEVDNTTVAELKDIAHRIRDLFKQFIK